MPLNSIKELEMVVLAPYLLIVVAEAMNVVVKPTRRTDTVSKIALPKVGVP